MSGGYALDALNITLTAPNAPIVNWLINGSTQVADWDTPTLALVRDNKPFEKNSNAIAMPKANSWYLWVIENALVPPNPHPIHLHGHDFFVIAQGDGVFNSSSTVNLHNPPRRDVNISILFVS